MPDWADEDYAYRKKITIDHAKVLEDCTDFPVLISVTDADLKDTANGGHVESSNGYDIIFYDITNTTLYYHEIERYVNTDGTLVFWVKIPVLDHDADTEFYMYYGKSGVAANPSSTSTWESAFQGVWHLKESGIATDREDSTANNNDADPNNFDGDEQQLGKIGYCTQFERAREEDIVLPDMTCGESYPFTYECWFKTSSQDADYGLLTGENNPDPYQRILLYMYNGSIRYNVRKVIGNQAEVIDASKNWRDGNWHYVVGVSANATSHKLYIDGILSGTNTTSVNSPALNAGRIGEWEYNASSTYNFDGYIDECRKTNANRSGNYITTTFNNLSEPSTFHSFDAEEELSAPTCTESGVRVWDGSANIEFCRDDSSPLRIWDGEVIGLELVDTGDAAASPLRIWDGTTVKAVKKKT